MIIFVLVPVAYLIRLNYLGDYAFRANLLTSVTFLG